MSIFAQSLWINGLFFAGGLALGIAVLGFREWGLSRSARTRRELLLSEARREAEQLVAKSRQDGEVQAESLRQEAIRAGEARTSKLDDQESHLQRREQALSGQLEALGQREEGIEQLRQSLEERAEALEAQSCDVQRLKETWEADLSRLAALSRADARKEVLASVEQEARREAQEMSRRLVDEALHESEEKARRILSITIQRYAGDHTSETTTAAVALKGDDIKGRIIGREGRNIRAFENATGMTVLIDDTPNAVVLSGFDPVRREIARESMERLIADGRIHPTRIEEVVERVSSEIEGRIVKLAEEAVFGLGLVPVHGEIAKRLGRLYFRQSYSQNVLDHSVEVARITGLLAAEVGADVTDAKRAGLLHDLGKALGDEVEGSHAIAGAEFIRRYGENPAVVNGVAAHHDEVEHETVIGILVSAADAISAARPGARSESIASYVNRLKSLEAIGMGFDGVEKCFAVQAGREVRVFVRPEEVPDEESEALARNICRKIEDELQYPGQIRVTVIREVRCIDYAK